VLAFSCGIFQSVNTSLLLWPVRPQKTTEVSTLVHQLFVVFKKVSWNFWLHRSLRMKCPFIKSTLNRFLMIVWENLTSSSGNEQFTPHEQCLHFPMEYFNQWTPASSPGLWGLKRQLQTALWYMSYLSYLTLSGREGQRWSWPGPEFISPAGVFFWTQGQAVSGFPACGWSPSVFTHCNTRVYGREVTLSRPHQGEIAWV
jgi:hypothetical protein